MKKLILSLFTICLVVTAGAQQGTWLLFGNLGFNNTKDEFKTTTIVWSANPGIGYQFNENWTAGLNLFWSQNSMTDVPGGSTKTTVNQGKFGVFGRYTHHFGNSVFYYYGQADVLMQQGYTTDSSAPAFNKHNGMIIDAYPAIGMQVGCNWGINVSFGGIAYMSDKQTTDATAHTISNANTASTIDVTFGRTINIGASVNLGCGKGKKNHEMKEKGGKKDKKGKKKSSDDDDDD
jgi:hypothetical protein